MIIVDCKDQQNTAQNHTKTHTHTNTQTNTVSDKKECFMTKQATRTIETEKEKNGIEYCLFCKSLAKLILFWNSIKKSNSKTSLQGKMIQTVSKIV